MRGAVVDAPMKGDRRACILGGMGRPNGGTILYVLVISFIALVNGATDPNDVSALNTMFTGFNSDPKLTNWVQNAGDPCGTNWLGVTCDGTFVTSIKLSNMGLNGKVEGWVLQKFQHLSVLDLSHNNLASGIPEMFPPKLTELDLSYNQLTGSFPYLIINIPTLTSIKLNNNKLSGTLDGQVFSKLTNLITLDISNNAITGPIPEGMGDMVSLRFLNMQNNKLTGPIPDTLANIPSLETLDVSNNALTGFLPPNLNPKNFRYGGNPLNTQAPPPPPFTPPPPSKNPKPIPPPPHPGSRTPDTAPKAEGGIVSGAAIAGIVVGAILVLAAIFIAVWFFVVRKRSELTKPLDLEANHSSRRTWFLPLIPAGKEKPPKMKVFEADTFEKEVEEPKIKALPPLKSLKVPPALKVEEATYKVESEGKVNKSNITAREFSVAELQAATDSFSEDNLLGEGSLGCVYRAEFPDGEVLAVKKLDTTASMVRNEDDFLSVVDGLARLQHTNSNELVGYCAEHGQRLLVYKFISRGTLHELLHGSADSPKELSWNVRVKIALGCARALEYFHEIVSQPVVHRNFRSSNILLDDELNPHVSDCGLAAFTPSSAERQVSAQVLGSFGYSPPEFSTSGMYDVKSDVYSFGVVMLELMTGRKPLDSSRPRSEQNLVRWATPQLHDIDALARMVDPALEGAYPAKSLSRFADIVALCVQPEPEFRPPISEVVQSLVRLMQRAALSKRRHEYNAGVPQTDMEDPSDYL
ncbi:protein STRUBBELIG-RECEPTOR FAMILY 8 isoform X1 [Physcomitrium patens]|uniref:Protein kinase domain-containing protein n=2 Tax=Physcomitrium patens TaxID=3218 RepID=A0A2K1KIW2_PHYPA|nr:protein STRUBBELIG-RECEPTOR FAMILY 8-like isoform X1 [Physcomitrium patens]XP_024376900.1 protein STRUBBELIG-RECEPTOR FAMILY 8-like isoform X1 [Physcomitrium patens]PNR53724.1 hypothetical protein PHYPA_007399 [Physcomitrium patens]|eukprot:XP_024376899.1 protein STRUBBELIG-RECEPTOR FAMILY 8-like isoform X1 [Physcomitrella patens]